MHKHIAIPALLLCLLLPPPVYGAILPNDSVIDGKTIGEWSAEWWKWVLPIPANRNPMLDNDGAFANEGQSSGNVFFVSFTLGIVPGTVTRQFTVPEGKYLFFPLMLYEADNVNTIPPLSIEQLRDQTAGYVNATTNLYANLDGIDLTNLYSHRASSPVFNFFYTNADNLQSWAFGGKPITGLIDPAVCDGYWLMLEPLPPGQHVLRFGGAVSIAVTTSDVVDYITVLPMPLPDRVQQLISSVTASNLSQSRKQVLLAPLRAAKLSFERNRTPLGISFLVRFQRLLARTHRVAGPGDLYIEAAQKIINKARAQLP
jgi:hypothetical protein